MILAIIQARTGSTRLPGKVLLHVEGKSIISHVVERVAAANLIDNLVVATTLNEGDVELVREVSALKHLVFCGSEDDVLDRYYQVAKHFQPKHIVRITADCPLIDPQVIDLVISQHLKSDADYTSNTLDIPYPDGQDVEVFKLESLNKAWKEARLASEREHVTPFIKLNEVDFNIKKVLSDEELSSMRWTLDEPEDLELITIIFKKLYGKNKLFSMKDVINLYKEDKSLKEINKMHIREEGYRKSLENDHYINND